MNKGTKIWLIVGTCLVILGLILFGTAMNINNGDFSKLGTVKYETNSWEIDEEFDHISIDSDTADIQFLPSEDGVGKVVCHEPTNEKHQVSVQDGILTIQLVPEKEWYDYISIANFENTEIKVYLPKNSYSELFIEESTGDVLIPKEFQFENIDVSVSTGDVQCFASAFQEIKIRTSTGDVRMEHVVATEKISIECSTGGVLLKKCDAPEIYITTDTGDVQGSLLSDKIFLVHTDTGRIDVPKTTTGGKCNIQTDTGDIRITIE